MTASEKGIDGGLSASPEAASADLSIDAGVKSVSGADHEHVGLTADLPVELQSKMFDRLSTFGIGGAGLTITLAGSLLRDAPSGLVWLAAVEFGLAALVAIGAQAKLINDIFEKRAFRRRAKLAVGISALLIGMGAGSLATSVALVGH